MLQWIIAKKPQISAYKTKQSIHIEKSLWMGKVTLLEVRANDTIQQIYEDYFSRKRNSNYYYYYKHASTMLQPKCNDVMKIN